MPELPEVEIVKRGMENAILDKEIQSVKINRYDLRVPMNSNFGQMVTGKVINKLERRGKYIIINIGADIHAILHLGMSGRIHISGLNDNYEEHKHDHIIFTFEDGTRFAFEDPRRFGLLYLTQDDWRKEKPFVAMGAEPLEDWTGADLFNSLKKKKTPIKTALLDQRVVAGLGNIYVCEALFKAGIAPTRLSNSINKVEAARIVKYSRAVLEQSIKSGGSTLKDYQHTDGTLGYFQHSFLVYDCEGNKCSNKSCSSEILRIVQAGRSTFHCPACQK